MAITVDWSNQVINVPKADTQFVETNPVSGLEVRQLDLNDFRLTLRDLEDDEDGIVWDRTHNHNTIITVGGVTLARVVEIINGYSVTFEDGQYAVNLVGANSNVADVTTVNQVSVRPQNSAGLIHLQEIQKGAFLGAVHINTSSGLPGVVYPRGTPSDPVDNITDARSIADTNKFKAYNFRGDLTVLTDHVNWNFFGLSAGFNDVLTLSSIDVSDSVFRGLVLKGVLTGMVEAIECRLEVVTGLDGIFRRCGLKGALAVANDSFVVFDSCFSEEPGTTTPIVTIGSNANVMFRNYSGGLELRGMAPGATVSVDLDPGRLVLHSSNTGGVVTVGGLGSFQDDSMGVTCVKRSLLNTEELDIMVQSEVGNVDISLDDLQITIKDKNLNNLRVLSVSADGRTKRIV